MDKLFAVGLGIAIGWWMKSLSEERKNLKAENERLKAKMEPKE